MGYALTTRHGVQSPLDGILHDKSEGAYYAPEQLFVLSGPHWLMAGIRLILAPCGGAGSVRPRPELKE